MEFLNPGEKIYKLRKSLKMKQQDMQDKNMTRSYYGMIEVGKRKINIELAQIIMGKFRKRAEELGIELDTDANYLILTPEEEAKQYCLNLLSNHTDRNSINDALETAQRYKLHSFEAQAYKILGDIDYSDHNFNSSFVNYSLSLDILKNISETNNQPFLYNRLGMCKYNQLNYSEALLYYERAKFYSEEYKNTDIETNSILNLALSYKELNLLDKSLEYLDLLFLKVDKFNNPEEYVCAHILKANCYESLDRVQGAINLLNYAVQSVPYIKRKTLADIYNNLGCLYLKNRDINNSLNYFNKSQEIREEIDECNLSHTLIEKSKVYTMQNLYNEALLLIDQSIELAKKHNDIEYILKGIYLENDIYLKLNNNEKIESNLLKLIDVLKNSTDKDELLKLYLKLARLYVDRKHIELVDYFLNLSQDTFDISHKFN